MRRQLSCPFQAIEHDHLGLGILCRGFLVVVKLEHVPAAVRALELFAELGAAHELLKVANHRGVVDMDLPRPEHGAVLNHLVRHGLVHGLGTPALEAQAGCPPSWFPS